MGQILRLEIKVTGIEASKLIGRLKHRLRMMLEGNVVRIDVSGLQAFGGIVPTPVLTDGQIAVLLRVACQVVVQVHLDVELLVRIGKFKIIRIARHGGTHMGFFVNYHETAREIEVVHVIAKDDKQVVARNKGHHVLSGELELVVDVINQGVAREGVVVQSVRIVPRGVLYTLNIGRLPIVTAMDERIVEHFALPVDDVERKG